MRTKEEKKLYLQIAFEEAFTKAEQIRTFIYLDKKGYIVLSVRLIIFPGRLCGCDIALADIEEKTANFDIFASKVNDAIEHTKEILREEK